MIIPSSSPSPNTKYFCFCLCFFFQRKPQIISGRNLVSILITMCHLRQSSLWVHVCAERHCLRTEHRLKLAICTPCLLLIAWGVVNSAQTRRTQETHKHHHAKTLDSDDRTAPEGSVFLNCVRWTAPDVGAFKGPRGGVLVCRGTNKSRI